MDRIERKHTTTTASVMADIHTTHSALIAAMDAFYRTLLDLDYLREDEVQFPPHTGSSKTPLATTAIHSANLSPDVQSLLHHLPYIISAGAGAELMEGEAAITLHSWPVSYLYKGADGFESGERWFGYGEGGGEVLLPPWGVLLFSGIRRDQRVVVYDTRSRKVAELSVYEPTVRELEAASVDVDELIGGWIRKLQTLDWVPWRDEDRFLGMEIPPSGEQENWLVDSEQRRLKLLESLPKDVAEEKFAGDLRTAREDHNCYWAKRVVFEKAGWPGVLDKERLREGVRELEKALWDAWDCAEGAEEEEEAMRGVWRRFAGGYGV